MLPDAHLQQARPARPRALPARWAPRSSPPRQDRGSVFCTLTRKSTTTRKSTLTTSRPRTPCRHRAYRRAVTAHAPRAGCCCPRRRWIRPTAARTWTSAWSGSMTARALRCEITRRAPSRASAPRDTAAARRTPRRRAWTRTSAGRAPSGFRRSSGTTATSGRRARTRRAALCAAARRTTWAPGQPRRRASTSTSASSARTRAGTPPSFRSESRRARGGF